MDTWFWGLNSARQGGGHKNAAGGISDLDVKGTVQKLKSLLPDFKEYLQ